MLYRDPLGEGKWEGPVEFLTWGRGYACVSVPTGHLWLPDKRVKPFHGRMTPQTLVDNSEQEVPSSPGPDQPAVSDGCDQMLIPDPNLSSETGHRDHSTT